MSALLPSTPLIRPAETADLKILANLENLSFNSPWSRLALARELENPASLVLLLQIDPDELPVAYLCARLIPPEAELLRIAVAPASRRQNLGRCLLRHLFSMLKQREITELFLEVAETNLPALDFYRQFDFIQTARRPGYYDQGKTAALILVCHLFS
jgi:ribosomal-protein-alanine N-acetyltransferase